MNWTAEELARSKAGARALGMSAPAVRGPLESTLQRATARLVQELEPSLHLPELIFHVANESADPRRRAIMAGHGVRNGVADWLVLSASPMLAVELKIGSNSLSSAQLAFAAAFQEAGGEFVVIRTLEGFAAALFNRGLIRLERRDVESVVRRVRIEALERWGEL